MPKLKIACKGASQVPINDLQFFQGNLKSLAEREYKKLRASIERHGFCFPVFVWNDNGTKNIIDGHQRIFVVKKMIEDGWVLEKNSLPVDWIEAENQKEAKEKVLLATSQYGKIDISDLYEFIEMEQLDTSTLKEILDIPMINLDYVFGPPDEVPDVEGTGEAKEQGNFLLIEFLDNETFEQIRSDLGLKGNVRSIKFPELIKKWELKKYN